MAAEVGAPIESLASEQAAVAAVAAAPPPARFARLDRILAAATEIPAAVLVFIEICVLLAGVVSRYVFNEPLTWTDELASILFLWLAMLGAVIALRRDEHMRLTTFVSWIGPRWGDRLGAIAALVVIAFVTRSLM
jgi:TRAP-type C4-dicarboxylate transport system permease small subunit